MQVDWEQVFESYSSLETERCILRKPTIHDAVHVFNLMSNPAVTQYLGRFPMASLEEGVKQVERYLSGFDEQSSMSWVICWHENNSVIGTISLFNLSKQHRRAEIGYILAPDWWGKGIMSEVIHTVIDCGFETMQLHSMFAQIDPENDASRRLLEKHGFIQEAYFREDFFHPVKERFTDSAILSLLKSSWHTNL